MSKKAVYFKAIFLFLTLALSVFFTVKYNLWSVFTDQARLVDLINTNKTFSILVFICLQIIQVIIAFIPGELTGFIGGYLFGIFWGSVYSSIGLCAGSLLTFYLARYFGRPVVLLFVSADHLKKFDYLMEHRGASLSAFLFIIPGFPKDYLCYILGLSTMTGRAFFIISTFGRLASTVLLTISGSLIRNQYYKLFTILAAFALLVILVMYIYRDHIEKFIKNSLK